MWWIFPTTQCSFFNLGSCGFGEIHQMDVFSPWALTLFGIKMAIVPRNIFHSTLKLGDKFLKCFLRANVCRNSLSGWEAPGSSNIVSCRSVPWGCTWSSYFHLETKEQVWQCEWKQTAVDMDASSLEAGINLVVWWQQQWQFFSIVHFVLQRKPGV